MQPLIASRHARLGRMAVRASHQLRRPAEKGLDFVGTRGDGLGTPLPRQRRGACGIRDAGQDQDGGDARSVGAGDVGVGVVADDHRIRGPDPARLQNGA